MSRLVFAIPRGATTDDIIRSACADLEDQNPIPECAGYAME